MGTLGFSVGVGWGQEVQGGLRGGCDQARLVALGVASGVRPWMSCRAYQAKGLCLQALCVFGWGGGRATLLTFQNSLQSSHVHSAKAPHPLTLGQVPHDTATLC